MSEKSISERVVANFFVAPDPHRDYVHWRNFLRQWFVLGPFSFADREYARSEPPERWMRPSWMTRRTWCRTRTGGGRAHLAALLGGGGDEQVVGAGPGAGAAEAASRAADAQHRSRAGAARRRARDDRPLHGRRRADAVLDIGAGRRAAGAVLPRAVKQPYRSGRSAAARAVSASAPTPPTAPGGFPPAWARPSYPYDYSVTYLAALVHAQEGGDYALRWSSTTPAASGSTARMRPASTVPFSSTARTGPASGTCSPIRCACGPAGIGGDQDGPVDFP